MGQDGPEDAFQASPTTLSPAGVGVSPAPSEVLDSSLESVGGPSGEALQTSLDFDISSYNHPADIPLRYCVDCGAPVPTVPGRIPRRRCRDCHILREHRHANEYDFIPREYRGNGYDKED